MNYRLMEYELSAYRAWPTVVFSFSQNLPSQIKNYIAIDIEYLIKICKYLTIVSIFQFELLRYYNFLDILSHRAFR